MPRTSSAKPLTDASGAYALPNLPPGTYRVTATKTGFQVARAENVTLQVEQAARLDLRLEVGNVSESVEVSATAALLQTENASVGTVIDSAKIVDLPLNGRNFIQLAQLIPGVQAGTPGSITVRRGRGSVGQTDAAYGSTAASANGSRDTANRFYIDGVEVMDYDAMTYSFSPSVDSLSEFKVQTSTYSAEYGGAPGGQVNMITKSGTNRLHGTLWEFNRNDQLTQSYDAIAGKSVTSPRLNRNQFGANVGGPIWIPKVYKGTDKTFFFFNWESGYAATGASSAFRIVPTQAMRNGDFSGLVDARTRAPIVLKDPLNIGIVGNVIPKAALSKEALAFLAFEPLPNTSNGTFNFATTAASATSTQRNFLGRIDRTLSSKDQIFGRYLLNDTYEAGTPVWGHDERNNLGRTQNFAASWTHIFRPTLINELRGGWHRFNEAEVFGTTNDAAYDVVGKMGLPLVSRLPEEYGPPSISLNGPDGVYNMYDLQRQIGPRIRSNSIAPFTDVISWQKGRHFLKFDAEVDRRGVTFGQARAPRGAFSFDGTYTGSAMADFILGYIRSDSVNPAHTSTDLYNYWVALSANDDFKITPRLTLNFGLRWDYFQRYKQKDDQMVNIQLNGFVVGDTVTTKTSPFGRELMAADWNNVGPRFGFAWRPPVAGETVVRGGYGIYYTPQISNAIFAMAEGAQATAGASLNGNIVGAPNLFFSNPFAGAVTNGALNFAVSNDQNMRDSYVQQWNLNVQHKLPGNVVLDMGYVGSKGTKLVVTYEDLNRPIQLVDPRTPGLASLNARRPNQLYQRNVRADKAIGNSIYHSFQAKAERRTSKGLVFLTAYTFSKSISGRRHGGQVGGGPVRHRRPGGRRKLHRRSAGRVLHARRSLRQRLRRHPAVRADRALRPAVRTQFPRLRQEGAGRLAALHHHDLPERLPGSRHLQHRYHRHRHQLPSRPGSRPARRPAGRPAHLEGLVQHRGLRAGSVRPLRHVTPHRRRPPARYHQCGLLDQQIAALPRNQIARIPLGVLQLPEELQSRSGDRRPEQPLRHIRRRRRRSPGHHDACDPTRS